jgi:hypothetical protein
MSYLHCPSCHRAYNIATHQTCPSCPVAATVVDPTADIVAAADQLARAIARATPGERARAVVRLDQLALPEVAEGSGPVRVDASIARGIRDVLAPQPSPAPAPRAPLIAAAIAFVDRIAPRLPTPRVVRRLLSRVRELRATL